MKKTKLNEQLRSKALKSLNLLDTSNEQELDDIVYLASQICQTPMAAISLIDDNRQWFKAELGLNIKETARDISFCERTINQEGTLIIEDALKHKDFTSNPLVLDYPNIKFYAGHPILEPKSMLPIGTLCVLDHNPRSLTQEQIKALKILAKQVEFHLKLRLRFEDMAYDKSNSILKLTKEIAHDLNTPLTVISLTSNQIVNLLEQQTPDFEKAKTKSRTIDSTVKKMSEIILKLKRIYQ